MAAPARASDPAWVTTGGAHLVGQWRRGLGVKGGGAVVGAGGSLRVQWPGPLLPPPPPLPPLLLPCSIV
jgi:hypothetical protein